MYTGFFRDITRKRNLVFSTGYFPRFHWYRDEDDEFDNDESMHYLRLPLRKVNKFIKKNITEHNTDNYLATNKLFKCLHIKLKVYIIYNINYMPNTNNLNTLINLALYGANTINSRLSELVKELPKSLLSFTQENNEHEKKNLLLDEGSIHLLQRFFRALDN